MRKEQIEHRIAWIKQTIGAYTLLYPDTEAEIDAIRDLALTAVEQSANSERAGWVAVSERLPEINAPVALLNADRWENCDHERNVQAAGYLSEVPGANGFKYWSVRGERAQSLDAFTHWFPLPLAAREE